jgi:hypothetical protein
MAGMTVRSFESAHEMRTPDKTKLDVVDRGTAKAARVTIQPGWRRSECIKPVVGGDSCQAHHVGVIDSGAMLVVHDDGTEGDAKAGDAYVIDWVTSVVGDEPVVALEFDSSPAQTYARPS